MLSNHCMCLDSAICSAGTSSPVDVWQHHRRVISWDDNIASRGWTLWFSSTTDIQPAEPKSMLMSRPVLRRGTPPLRCSRQWLSRASSQGYIISAWSLEMTTSPTPDGPCAPPLPPTNRAISEIVSFGTTPINARLTLIGLSNWRTVGGSYSISTEFGSFMTLWSWSNRKRVSGSRDLPSVDSVLRWR